MKAISIGEILWDVLPQGEFLGGAPYNFACHLARLNHEVELVTTVGDDPRGRAALAEAAAQGVGLQFAQVSPALPTGVVLVSFQPDGQPLYRIERPAAYDATVLAPPDLARIAVWRPDWICYGSLFHNNPEVLKATRRLFKACPNAHRFYDVNLRPGQQDADLVRELAGWANAIKLSEEESPEAASMLEIRDQEPGGFLDALVARYELEAACLTQGRKGCLILARGEFAQCPGVPVAQADPVGAGDAFAAAFLHGLDQAWDAAAIGAFANRVGALVASRRGATPSWTLADLECLPFTKKMRSRHGEG